MSYSLTVFLTDQSELTLKILTERLKEKFSNDPSVQVQIKQARDSSIIVQDGVWTIRVIFMCDPYDPTELKKIVRDNAANHPDRLKIVSCKRWLYIYSDDDPDMDYFHDYLHIVDVLDKFPHVYMFDQQEELFLEQDKGKPQSLR